MVININTSIIEKFGFVQQDFFFQMSRTLYAFNPVALDMYTCKYACVHCNGEAPR